jgi:large conductance mechanosensitive channel
VWAEFKRFVSRGNVVDLAVAVVIGAAFGAIVKSLVDDVIMPPVGLLTGRINFSDQFLLLRPGLAAPAPYLTLEDAVAAGAVTLNYGRFLNSVVTFVIVAAAVFVLVKALGRLMPAPPPPAATTRECPRCFTAIRKEATRCAACTSEVGPVVSPSPPG